MIASTLIRIENACTNFGEDAKTPKRENMPSAKSYYHRRPGRFAKEKREFQRLIEELKKRADERGHTRQQVASELGVSLACINKWWFGRAL
jgi:hypothetical protein